MNVIQCNNSNDSWIAIFSHPTIMEAIHLTADRGTPLPCLISWLLYLRMFQFVVAATVMSLAAFSWSRLENISWEIVYTTAAVLHHP